MELLSLVKRQRKEPPSALTAYDSLTSILVTLSWPPTHTENNTLMYSP